MNVPEILRQTGLVLKEEWLNTTGNDLLSLYHQTNTSSSSGLASNTSSQTISGSTLSPVSVEQAAETILERVLREDLRVCSVGTLPPHIHKLHKEILPGPYLVQVEEILDIGSSSSSNNNNTINTTTNNTLNSMEDDTNTTSSSYTRRCLKLALADGSIQQIYGIEYTVLKDLSIHSYAGIKLLLKNIEIRRGLLLLTPSNTLVLGGSVPYLSYMQEEANIIHHDQEQPQPQPQPQGQPPHRPPESPSTTTTMMSTTTDTYKGHNPVTDNTHARLPLSTSTPPFEPSSANITTTTTNILTSSPPVQSVLSNRSRIEPSSSSKKQQDATEITIIDDDVSIEMNIVPAIAVPSSSQSTGNLTIPSSSTDTVLSSGKARIVRNWKELQNYTTTMMMMNPDSKHSTVEVVMVHGILCFVRDFTYTNNQYSLSAFITDIGTGNEILSLIRKENNDRTEIMTSITDLSTLGVWMQFTSSFLQTVYLANTEPNQLENLLRTKDKESKEARRRAKDMVADMEEKIYSDGIGKPTTIIDNKEKGEEYEHYTGVTMKVEIHRFFSSPSFSSTSLPKNNDIVIEYYIQSLHAQ